MRLYHASTVRVEKPDTQHARPNLDFGCGFYLTALRSHALIERHLHFVTAAVEDDRKVFALE